MLRTCGVISGTPVAVSSGTYTVTASDAAGAATAALTLVIYGRPLTAVTYTSPVTATVGAAFTPLVPTLSGHADSFTVFPPLPAGLTLDPVTGIVSGTPTSARPAYTYSIAASNVYGSSVAALLLTVDPPPGSLRARRARTAVGKATTTHGGIPSQHPSAKMENLTWGTARGIVPAEQKYFQ